MKKQGIDRSTDLYYSNSRSREVRPDQSIKLQSSADKLREVMIFPRAATADREPLEDIGNLFHKIAKSLDVERNLAGEINGSGI